MSNGRWKPQRPRRSAIDSGWFRGLNLALSFGVTLAVSMWITWKVGSWLDAYFNTEFIFTFVCVLIGIGSSFRVLMYELKHIDDSTNERMKK